MRRWMVPEGIAEVDGGHLCRMLPLPALVLDTAEGATRHGGPGPVACETSTAGRPERHLRGKVSDRRGNMRVTKPAGDGRIPPRSLSGEQRRGGVGMLIGITFA